MDETDFPTNDQTTPPTQAEEIMVEFNFSGMPVRFLPNSSLTTSAKDRLTLKSQQNGMEGSHFVEFLKFKSIYLKKAFQPARKNIKG